MENVKESNGFVAYEYLTVEVKSVNETLYTDCYKNFGWIPEGRDAGFSAVGKVTLKFKRDRKIPNRRELCELQRKCENSLNEVNALESSKTTMAAGASLGVGLLGTAAMAGSVFCYLAPLYVPFGILGAVGLALWAAPYFIYKAIKRKKTVKANTLVDKEFDVIYNTCELGSKQLAR